MGNITTPKAILIGFTFVALSIMSLPYHSFIISPANAFYHEVSPDSDSHEVPPDSDRIADKARELSELNSRNLVLIAAGLSSIAGGMSDLTRSISDISACRN